MAMNWTNLPAHVFKNIFKYCSIYDLNASSFVCRSWYEEIADSWSVYFVLKCCYVYNDLQTLAKSSRQFKNLEICHSHIYYAEKIISTITTRNLRRQCQILKIDIGTKSPGIAVSFEEVVKVLNACRHLTVVKMTQLFYEDYLQVDLVLNKMPYVRCLQLHLGNKDLSLKTLDVLCGGFAGVKVLELRGCEQGSSITQNMLLRNLESLEDLRIMHYYNLYNLDSIKHLKNLKSVSIAFVTGEKLSPPKLNIDLLKSNTKLQTLRLQVCRVSNEDILKIPKYFPHLKNIQLYFDEDVESDSLHAIGGLPDLTSIGLVFGENFPSGFEEFFESCNKNLKSLELTGFQQFMFKPLQVQVDRARSNPLTIDVILENLTKLEFLSIKISSLKLQNQNNLTFSNLKTFILKGCESQETAHDLFLKLKAPKLKFFDADMLGMSLDSRALDVILSNFNNLRRLNLVLDNILSLQEMKSLQKAKLAKVSLYVFH